jgi:hypothetical protein
MASSSKVEMSNGKVLEMQLAGDFAIKSEAVTPKLGEWWSFSWRPAASGILGWDYTAADTSIDLWLTIRHFAVAFAVEKL